MQSLVLASTSPRRKQLLEQVGLHFRVVAPHYEEDITLCEDPEDLAFTLALGKAQSVQAQYPESIIVGADTFIYFENEVLGKPESPARAKAMLQRLRGQANQVLTGYAVVDPQNETFDVGFVRSDVFMRDYTDDEIDRYVATDEPLDKAGSYAVNGIGALLIDHIDGDFSAIVGLPLGPVCKALQTYGIRVF